MNRFTQFASVAALGLLSALGPASAQTYNLTLCGASPGGLWSLLGAGVDAAVKKAYPGSTVTYQTSGGGLANVGLLDKGNCDLAIIHDAEAKAAIQGLPPFDAPVESLATLGVLYTWAPMQIIANADFVQEHGITSLEDIATQQIPVQVVLNRRGNIVSGIGEAMLVAAGANPENIASWGGDVQYAASNEQGDLMRDRRVDMLINSLFVNHSSIRELASAIDVKLLPISADTAQAVIDEWDIQNFTIPADAYDWVDEDVATITVSAQLFVRADADDALVGNLTKALTDNFTELQGVHKAMAPLDVELMSSATTVDYHPAAKAVYSAAGF
ncbi:TAXI family TRAP transporter solute-binding subunit [Vannielia litorea]|uniref:TAXI family TRAP transporter solute-binding subunit n=1 Tax=Vannielia litorea TaxID=1217970 RepID=UPI001BCFB221|nr:TAXI family TRAP transporter solute-binding subunit [Vannielia litorea]MBS8224666.1 ABC transporter substrate-binding protein [Vannielia litorea]